jgi:methylated-DNA-protein-cysteine methyltransferase-like protein
VSTRIASAGRGASEFERRAVDVLAALGPGEVVSYGDVAEDAGFPGRARAVGRILATSEGLPWWRVVAANGRLVPGHEAEHAQRLRSEGVLVEAGRVVQAPFGRFRGPVVRSRRPSPP